jgi:hypothetical protein
VSRTPIWPAHSNRNQIATSEYNAPPTAALGSIQELLVRGNPETCVTLKKWTCCVANRRGMVIASLPLSTPPLQHQATTPFFR